MDANYKKKYLTDSLKKRCETIQLSEILCIYIHICDVLELQESHQYRTDGNIRKQFLSIIVTAILTKEIRKKSLKKSSCVNTRDMA
jgi:hypothetical protein